ncbi:MAG: sigma-70 family RNA polymerase sigma factor [Gemmatimonadetes bacterium]|jgi:RNA polymerase sigma-70 factor (ECF subfamily)|nr:sigma-70 family RNA polymerase sigma factor [Gemmatimonadota bacterium]
MTDEQDLIQQAQQGDGGAIQALYRRYADRVYSVVRRLAGDDALAEDWAQEAWVRAITALPNFRGEAQFGTWLHRIAVNSALGGRRSRERRVARETPIEEIATQPEAERALLRLRLERAIEALPERMRQILVLHDIEGYTHVEIGIQLGIAPGTCKSQLFKARARMRELLRTRSERIEESETCNT